MEIGQQDSIGDIILRASKRYPGKIAVKSDKKKFTYSELNSLVNKLANAFLKLGIAPNDKVVLLFDNSHLYPITFFALAKIGAVSVPVNTRFIGKEISFVVNHSDAKAILFDAKYYDVIQSERKILNKVKYFIGCSENREVRYENEVIDFNALIDVQKDDEPACSSHDDRIVQILYTSGTEALPKGAMLSQGGLIKQYLSTIYEGGFETDDIVLHTHPLFHVAQLHAFLIPFLYIGATNIIVKKPVIEEIPEIIDVEKVTHLFLTPTVWIQLLNHPDINKYNLSSLKKGVYGSTIMPIKVLENVQHKFKGIGLWNFYGQTEMGGLSSVLKPHQQLIKPGSVGLPSLNIEVCLENETGQQRKRGNGELLIKSGQLMKGYYKDEEKTKECFQGGWFHTGDIARIDTDGYIYIIDRKKDIIKSGGENISAREVEEVIYKFPAVAETSVIGLPHPKWIEMVTAIIVPKPGKNIVIEELLAHCKNNLAGYKIPKKVFIERDLPKNACGKILKRELRSIYIDKLKEKILTI
jgi:fatty-acyl-CoA synthase